LPVILDEVVDLRRLIDLQDCGPSELDCPLLDLAQEEAQFPGVSIKQHVEWCRRFSVDLDSFSVL
jgi:hypothetical protein